MLRSKETQTLINELDQPNWNWSAFEELIPIQAALARIGDTRKNRVLLLEALSQGLVRSVASKAYVAVAMGARKPKSRSDIINASYITGRRGVIHETICISENFWTTEFASSDGEWIETDPFFTNWLEVDWTAASFTYVDVAFPWGDDNPDYPERTVLVTMLGVQLITSDFEVVFPCGHSAQQRQAEEDDAENKSSKKGRSRGRRGAQHGEVIAAVTLRLATLSKPELNRYTAESLALELHAAYVEYGETPPSEENCKRYCQGILRTLRN